MALRIGIVGGGVTGRLLALSLLRRRHHVTLFEAQEPAAKLSASHAAAGLLCPWSERETASPLVQKLGEKSLPLWSEFLTQLNEPVFHIHTGSLVVAHHGDETELERLSRRLANSEHAPEVVSRREIADLEPALNPRFERALFFRDEGVIHSRGFLSASGRALESLGVLKAPQPVHQLRPNAIQWANGELQCDGVVDTRGLYAQPDWRELRGVRGERITLHAPKITIRHPIRLCHPRYSLYVVPWPNDRIVIGATQIESEDAGPITMRSMLELLSAAYSVCDGLAEARVEELVTGLRPTLPSGDPKIRTAPGLLRINGLFRHGYLTAPAIAQIVCEFLETGNRGQMPELFEESL